LADDGDAFGTGTAWHGWPLQIWDGKDWVVIEPAKLAVAQPLDDLLVNWLADT
jgi:hypothetical protein